MPDGSADGALRSYRLGRLPLMVIGTHQRGVTVYSQQVRALNLAWASVEAGVVPCTIGREPSAAAKRIAVVGAGFAGLTFAAGLLKKHVDAEIYLFEQRDTLLPLQHGSDARWLHPRIYEWPAEGSETQVAMLPALNWTAARASDVVVQVLAEWDKVAKGRKREIHLFCNTRHLQIHRSASSASRLRIEWVGERRHCGDGTMLENGSGNAVGKTKNFDLVVLAVGFGLEKDSAHSYWRNDIAGQPSLDARRRTFLVSGQGDGAMVDLLRIRISQYRQDRILEELFHGKDRLFGELKKLKADDGPAKRSGLFEELERLSRDEKCGVEMNEVKKRLLKD